MPGLTECSPPVKSWPSCTDGDTPYNLQSVQFLHKEVLQSKSNYLRLVKLSTMLSSSSELGIFCKISLTGSVFLKARFSDFNYRAFFVSRFY